MPNIYQKLQQVRVDLQEMNLKMTGSNTYSNYKYYELGDFLPAVNELCNKHKLFTKFQMVQDNKRAVLTVINSEEPEEKLDFTSIVATVEIGKKKDGTGGAEPIQNLGGQITYMRRYLMMMAFEIVESDLVEQIRKEKANDLEDKDKKKIKATKTVKDLTDVCGKLKEKYKVEVIKPYYEKQKEAIVVNQDGGKK